MSIQKLTDDDGSDYYDVGMDDMKRIKSLLQTIKMHKTTLNPNLIKETESLLGEIEAGEF